MSNLVHRRRRCARIVHTQYCCLEGSTPEDGSGASHQSKVIVVAPWEPILYCQRQLFCFVAFRLPRADQTDVDGLTGKLAFMVEHSRRAARS